MWWHCVSRSTGCCWLARHYRTMWRNSSVSSTSSSQSDSTASKPSSSTLAISNLILKFRNSKRWDWLFSVLSLQELWFIGCLHGLYLWADIEWCVYFDHLRTCCSVRVMWHAAVGLMEAPGRHLWSAFLCGCWLPPLSRHFSSCLLQYLDLWHVMSLFEHW